MKHYLSAVLAATLIAGLSACGTGTPAASTSASSTSTPAPEQTDRPVPSVVGVNFQDARKTLIDADFVVEIFGKDGKEWTGYFPDSTVMVSSTSPAAGTVTDAETIRVTVGISESETADGKAKAKAEADAKKAEAQAGEDAKKAEAKAAEDAAAAKLAARYTFDCSGNGTYSDGYPGVYKSLKAVWASKEYKNREAHCGVKVDGLDATDVKPLLPAEKAIAKVIAAHGGGTYGNPAGDFGTALELCAKAPVDYADAANGVLAATRADAYGALALCPKAPHAGLLRRVATTIKISDGTYTVGKDMAAGTYKTEPGAKDCYWSRNDGGGNIIDNNFIGFAPDGATVTVFPGEGFESNNCPVWTKIG